MVNIEFQAIVLAAGRGSRLPEVLGDVPKCLLPVGPYPLLWYPLNMLQQHGFTDAIVIVLECEKTEIQQAIERTTLKIRVDYVSISDDCDFGTADSLRHIHDKIKCDFLVLTCDIITNGSLYPLINKFREHDASCVILLFQNGFGADISIPGPKNKHKPERDLIGVHPETQRLIFMASMSDFDNIVRLNGHLMRKHDVMTMNSQLLDGHIYVFKKWVIDYLEKKDRISTLKGEFVPYLVKQQLYKHTASSNGNGSGTATATTGTPALDTTSEVGAEVKPEDHISHFVSISSLNERTQELTLFNDSRSRAAYHGDPVRCYAIEAPDNVFGIRVNTTHSFYAINRKLFSVWTRLFPNDTPALISPNAVVNSTQTKEIVAAENAKLSEKTSLNFSCFGPNCLIKPKNVINNSVIMGHAVIEEFCNIDNCIVGYHAHIKKGSTLKNCFIGPNYVVEEESKEQAAHLSGAEAFMDLDEQ